MKSREATVDAIASLLKSEGQYVNLYKAVKIGHMTLRQASRLIEYGVIKLGAVVDYDYNLGHSYKVRLTKIGNLLVQKILN